MRCVYVNCDREAEVILVLDGHMRPLCKRHFKRFIRALEQLARQGEASLNDIEVKREKGRIAIA